MKITLTKKQYEQLIKIVFLGKWMADATEVDEEKDYTEIEQYILSFARDAGLEDLVEYDPEYKQYFNTSSFEEQSGVSDLIQRYDDYTFWEELIFRLSYRDLVKKHGTPAVDAMSAEQRLKEQNGYAERYEKEFNEHGLDNLALREIRLVKS